MRRVLLGLVAVGLLVLWVGCGSGGSKFEQPEDPTPPPPKNSLSPVTGPAAVSPAKPGMPLPKARR